MPGNTFVSLRFLKRLDVYKREKPYWLFVGKPSMVEQAEITNVQLETVQNVPVHDVRNDGETYTLDEHGFQFVTYDPEPVDFSDEASVREVYVPQVEKIIHDHVPLAHRIHIFDWRIRRQMTPEEMDKLLSAAQIQDRTVVLAPSETVHTDTTEFSLLKRVRSEFPNEADELLSGRVRMINFWRPLCTTVHDWPLLVCDGSNTPSDILVAVDQVARNFVGDIYYAHYSPALNWFYMSLMGTTEGVLFKNWDTASGVPSKRK
ncbi:hypothetical protein AB5N19_10182 [Seiridium cardinale]